MQELLSLANHLADEAGTVVKRYFRQPFDVERKSDETPVTIADRTVEATMRRIIEGKRPEDGILGEEYGPKESKNGYTWVLDPIDGTKSFVVGRPSFGTLVALCKDGVPVLGIIDQAILGERWAGADGLGTTFNGMQVKTRPYKSLKESRIASTSPSQIPNLWPRLYRDCGIVIWGGDCYSYGLMANGWLDGVVENNLAPYDFAAIPPIINNAGGLMCDWSGQPLTLASKGDAIAMGNPALKEEYLKLVA